MSENLTPHGNIRQSYWSAWFYAGYYHNADTQIYFDHKTGGYYSGTDSKWYWYDSTSQQFQEWQQTSS